MILDGVRGKHSRIMVGWDAVIFDVWVRLFPRIFASSVGKKVVGLTAVILRKSYWPAFQIGLFFFLCRKFYKW
jgi:hypothetical protein